MGSDGFLLWVLTNHPEIFKKFNRKSNKLKHIVVFRSRQKLIINDVSCALNNINSKFLHDHIKRKKTLFFMKKILILPGIYWFYGPTIKNNNKR